MEQPDPWKPPREARTSSLTKVKAGAVPTPVLARAEQLCDLVDEADGIRPDRQDLIAALVYAAEPNGAKLAAAWKKYRIAPVHAVLVNESAVEGPIDLSGYKRR
jgi:hypothetical protein